MISTIIIKHAGLAIRPLVRIALFTLVITTQLRGAGTIFDARKYGAVGDGMTLDTQAIQRAIDAAASGEGTVRLSSGTFLSGSLVMKSGVTLLIEKDAILLGSPRHEDYIKNRWLALLEAKGQHSIAVIGGGTIDGQGKALADDVLRLVKENKIIDPLASNRPDEKNRPQIIEFVDCNGVTVQGVTLKNSSCWVQTYDNCEQVCLDHVTVRSTASWNNDGIDLYDCRHATVTHCDIDSDDDGICLKSGENGACEDISVENCKVRSSASGFKLGTSSRGAFRRITVRGLSIYDTFRTAIALESVDGAEIQGVEISDVQAKNTGGAIFIRLGHRNKKGGPGSIHDVRISNVNVEIPAGPPDAGYEHSGPQILKVPHNLFPSSIVGLPEHRISNVLLKNIIVTTAGGGRSDFAQVPFDKPLLIPELADKYPEFSMFGELPAWAFYIRHAEGITFENVSFQASQMDFRPAVVIDDGVNIQFKKVTFNPANDNPVIVLSGVKDFKLTDTPLPTGAKEMVRELP